MYAIDQTRRTAIAQGMSQLFKPIYDAEFRNQYPNEIDFYKYHFYFLTLTFKQNKITLHDRSGLSTNPCIYQKRIDEQAGGFVALNSKNISELRHLANKHEIADANTLPKLDLIFAIEDKLGIKHQRILQRPIVAVRPKPHPLKVFGYLHYNIARACLGANLHRKLRYQPRALAYVDFEGTRNGASVDPLNSTWIHVHTAIFIGPEHTDKFNEYRSALKDHFQAKKWQREIDTLNQLWRQRGLTAGQQEHRLDLHKWVRASSKLVLQGDLAALHDVKIDPYSPSNPLAKLLGYSSKGADQVPTHCVRKDNRMCEGVYWGADDLYDVFPRQLVAKIAAPVDQDIPSHSRIALPPLELGPVEAERASFFGS